MNCDCFCHIGQVTIGVGNDCIHCFEMHGGFQPSTQPAIAKQDRNGNLYVNGQPVGTVNPGQVIMHTTTYGDELADQHPTTTIFENPVDGLRQLNQAMQGSISLSEDEANSLINSLTRAGMRVPEPMRQAIKPHAKAIGEIAVLADLHEAGKITDEDYAEQLERLLAS